MGLFNKKRDEPVKATLDNVLADPAEFHEKNVRLEGLVIDKVVGDLPVYIMAHQEGSPVKGVIWVFYPGASLAVFSEAGQKVTVEGKFYQDGKGTVGERGNHVEAYKFENPSLTEAGLRI